MKRGESELKAELLALTDEEETFHSAVEALHEWASAERECGDLAHSAQAIVSRLHAVIHGETLPPEESPVFPVERHQDQKHSFLVYGAQHMGWCEHCGLMVRALGQPRQRYFQPGRAGELTALPLCPGRAPLVPDAPEPSPET